MALSRTRICIILCFSLTLLGPSLAFPTSASKSRSLLPGDAYFDVKCTSDVTDISKSPASRWEAAKADLAMNAVGHRWNHGTDGPPPDIPLGYVNTMMKMFGMSEQNCGIVEDSCDFSSLSCADQSLPNPHPPTPAAWLILRSLTNFHSFYLNLYNSMKNAQDKLTDTMGSFATTFAPGAPEPSLIDKFFEGLQGAVLDFLIGQALGPLGNALEDLGDGKDAAMGVLEQGFDALKGLADGELPPELTPEEKKATLVETLSGIAEKYKQAISDYTQMMLSGQTGWLSKFANQLSGGNWVFNKLREDMFDMQTALQKGFSAMLISSAWKLADKAYPLILVRDEQCFMGSPTDLIDGDIVHAGGSCAVEGKTMWLVGFTGDVCYQNPLSGGARIPCGRNIFKKLPGFDDLEAKTGVYKDAIIRSSWKAYTANGNRNGYRLEISGSNAFTEGVETAGLYQIPICNIDEAIKNYQNNLGGPLCDYGGW